MKHSLAPRGALKKEGEEWVGAPFKVGSLTWGSQGLQNCLKLVRSSKEGDAEVRAARNGGGGREGEKDADMYICVYTAVHSHKETGIHTTLGEACAAGIPSC